MRMYEDPTKFTIGGRYLIRENMTKYDPILEVIILDRSLKCYKIEYINGSTAWEIIDDFDKKYHAIEELETE